MSFNIPTPTLPSRFYQIWTSCELENPFSEQPPHTAGKLEGLFFLYGFYCSAFSFFPHGAVLSRAPGVQASFLQRQAAVGLNFTCCFPNLRQLANCWRVVFTPRIVASFHLLVSCTWHTRQMSFLKACTRFYTVLGMETPLLHPRTSDTCNMYSTTVLYPYS